ncbi:MAG: methyltransferase [Phycisphaerae bacterium]
MSSADPEHFRGYPVTRRRVDVAGCTYELLGPANFDALVDDPRTARRFAADEYLPYWAEFWPACVLLAERVAAWGPAPAVAPPNVLELGAGLGLVGLVATGLGYPTVISDYDEDSLAFVLESARVSGLAPATVRAVDWRETYPDLVADRIVAAEVLYERRSLAPIAAFLRRHLKPGGAALLCDAWRSTADGFADAARQESLAVEIEPVERARPDADKPLAARFFHVRHVEDLARGSRAPRG